MIERILQDLAEGHAPNGICPDPVLLREVMTAMMEGTIKHTELAALLMGLRCRGERAEHIKVTVDVLKQQAVPFPFDGTGDLYDTCGTGGDHIGTVNISTAAALLAAAAGIPIAKHGNRSVSSRSGSADVIEALGLRIDCKPEASGELLRDYNFCFLLAPFYHPAMRHASIPRKEIQIRTIFNLAGPLANPAGITRQLLGVAREPLVEPMARTLQMLGRKRALVVNGHNGEDEISLNSVTRGMELREDGKLVPFTLDPRDLGIHPAPMKELLVDGPKDSAERVLRVLAGESGAATDVVNLNVAGVFYVAGRARDMKEAYAQACDVQRSGKALQLVEALRDVMPGCEGTPKK